MSAYTLAKKDRGKARFHGMQKRKLHAACTRILRSVEKTIDSLKTFKAEVEAIEWHDGEVEEHGEYAPELEKCAMEIGHLEDFVESVLAWRKEMCGA